MAILFSQTASVQQDSNALPKYCPSPILLANYAGPQMRRMIWIVNVAVMVQATKAKVQSSPPSSSLPAA